MLDKWCVFIKNIGHMRFYGYFTYMLISTILLVAAPAHGASLELGVYGYDSRMVYELVRTEVMPADSREVCSTSQLQVVGQVYAEMFKLNSREVCSDSLVVVPRPEEPEGICKFTGLGDMGSDYLDDGGESDEAVLVALDLTSYRMNTKAERSVKYNLRSFTGSIKKRFSLYLSRSSRYVRMMKSILREEGLPEDIVYLALIESGFNPRAYSPSQAAGPWQFMKGTAKRYRLKVNYWVDERRDPVKSTRAAAKYLTYLHDMFDSWSLAMAAYNAGEGRIRRALRNTNSKDFWALMSTNKIKPETKNYVPKFIAARLIATYPEKYGFTDIKYQEDFSFDEVQLKRQMKISMAARCAGVGVKVIKELNPELLRDSTPPVASYRLRIPRGTREEFVNNALLLAGSGSVVVQRYTVEHGDSLDRISDKTGVSGKAILAFNRLVDDESLLTGQTLLLPHILAD